MNKKVFAILPAVALFFGFSVLLSAQSAIAQNAVSDSNTVKELRTSLQAFKEARVKEMTEKQNAAKERLETKRTEIETKRAAFARERDIQRKTVLLKIIDLRVAELERIKERVKNMPNIEETLKTEASSKIDTMIAPLNQYKTRIQTATTTAELKILVAENQSLLKTHREAVKVIVESIHFSRLGGAISKAEDRFAAIKTRIDAWKADGKNVSELETLLGEADTKISEAKSNLTEKSYDAVIEALKAAYQKFKDISSGSKNIK